MNVINQFHIDKSINYIEYKNLINELFNQGKTTGDDQSQEMIDYTKMNINRMNRLEKTVELNNELITEVNKIDSKYYWVCMTEAWCGDAAQILPIIDKVCLLNSNIDLKILLRDENPEVINDNLTNGSKSIPKLIILDNNLNKIISWGPRPQILNDFVSEYKKRPDFSKAEMIKEIQMWYNKDNTKSLQSDIVNLIKNIVL